MTAKPYIYFEDQETGGRRYYQNPREIICAYTTSEIAPALARMEAARADGYYLAGSFSYELGYVLEPALQGLFTPREDVPLLQFGVFKKYGKDLPVRALGQAYGFAPAWTRAQYERRFDKVAAYIRAGDVYQINLTFPMCGRYRGSPMGVYQSLKTRQPVRYGGVVNLGGDALVTMSPELFFESKGGAISMRPMKGTIKRGDTPAQDKALAAYLGADEKNRAENLMIVDLLRNDMARIARAGSVEVTDLFTVETYPSLHTMTSGIKAQMKDVDFAQILRALFPCGSVTGAPKIRAMEIIGELEGRPRGAYCGAVGFIDPCGHMVFNVAIRTLSLREDGTCSYGIGGGVVADSRADDEYDECLLKAKILNDFGLIETMAWHADSGFTNLDLHLARLKKSARVLGFRFRARKIRAALSKYAGGLIGQQKVRLELARDGQLALSNMPLNNTKNMEIALSKYPVESDNALLAYKTTRRSFIDRERARLSKLTDCKEVLFFNQRGELCEGSFTNVFIRRGGELLTPLLSCGLLPGVLRQSLIASGAAQERILTQADLVSADEILIGNSARGLLSARLFSADRL